ncbi:MAG TPA: radical SAM protein [Butyricicoccus pullicaecorum]|nr:radical SAM protein [Butyricicoccus pullicaecorum]
MEPNAYRHCTLCPRGCGVDRTSGARGFCGASDVVYVGCAALHAWEEPPLSGERGSGTVFFTHCTLGCVFCQNRTISRREAQGKPVTQERLTEIFLGLQTQGAHNINLVTASHYAPTVQAALQQARAQGLHIPVVYNCGGYETVETLRMLDGLIDIYLPDFKYYSSYYAGMYSGAPDYPDFAKEAIAEMVRQTGAPQFDQTRMMTRGTIVRHLMLPGLAGDTAQVLRYLAEHFGDQILVSLMRQYTPFGMAERYPELDRKITDEEYEQAVMLFSELGLAGFLQDKESISESFIPSFEGQGA